MKDKNKQIHYESMSLEELTSQADQIVKYLENLENIEPEIEKYHDLLRLNNLIEKKFQKNAKEINFKTEEKIKYISVKKNAT